MKPTNPRFVFLLAGLILVIGGVIFGLKPTEPAVQDDGKPAAAAPASHGGDKPAAAVHAPSDLYQLPTTDDPDALLAYIDKVREFRPTSKDEFLAHQANALPAIVAAAEKILELAKDPQSEAARKAAEMLLEIRIDSIAQATPEQQAALLQQFEKSLQGRKLTVNDLSTAMNLAMKLEFSPGKPTLAAQAYADFGKIFAAAGDPGFDDMLARFQGAVRRLTLIGKPFELRGTTLDGKPFDWSQYRGKVVLVDFWATWCKPCRQELPNVRRVYEKYHDQSFDVVGVSLDDDRGALDKFLQREELPWVTLNDANKSGGNNPMAVYYDISSIPAVFLVDKQGIVVSMKARGERLEEEVAGLLGPAKDSKADAAAGNP